jgi:hypothetical protein
MAEDIRTSQDRAGDRRVVDQALETGHGLLPVVEAPKADGWVTNIM